MKYIVFLDFDGVLTSNRVHYSRDDEYDMWSKFDPVAIDFFNKIHDRFEDVSFVLTTTWKEYLDIKDMGLYHILQSMFRNSGFKGRLGDPWKVNPDNFERFSPRDRACAIKDYLDNFGAKTEDYIIFDDIDFSFERVLGQRRLVQTDPENGLLHKHMLKAMSMMGVWDKRNVK